MASICTNFPYDVHSEPTEDWTIEQLLQWCLLQSFDKTNTKRDELIAALNEQLEKGKAEVWSTHEKELSAVTQNKAYSNDAGHDQENCAPNVSSPGNVSGGTTEINHETTKEQKIDSVKVDVMEGPYAGKSVVLKPRARQICYVGRSAGKKFRDKGMSFPKDPEVSTTHGKFEMKAGKIIFVDMGSTNGTLCNGQEIQPEVPLELTEGMILQIGGAKCMISLGYN